MSARVWVDYNMTDSRGEALSTFDYVEGHVRAGDAVVTFDGDGNECPGVVTRIEPTGLVGVRLDRARFRAGS